MAGYTRHLQHLGNVLVMHSRIILRPETTSHKYNKNRATVFNPMTDMASLVIIYKQYVDHFIDIY